MSSLETRKARIRTAAENGNFAAAHTMLVALLEEGFKDADIMANLGGVLFHRGDLRGAQEVLEECLLLSPDHLVGHINLGNTLGGLGEFGQASSHYQFVLDQRPGEPLAAAGLAQALLKSQSFQQAVEQCDEFLSQYGPHPAVLLNKAEAHARQNQLPEAIRVAGEALRQAADQPSARVNALLALGTYLHSFGRPFDAIEYLKKAIELDPCNGHIHAVSGLCCRDIADLPGEKTAYAKAWRHTRSYADAVNFYLVQPSFPSCVEEITRYRSRYFRGIKKLQALSLDSVCRSDHHWYMHPFSMAYHHGSMARPMQVFSQVISRDLRARRADLFEQAFAPLAVPKKGVDKRVKIIFVSDFLYGHSNQRAFEGLIKYLDRSLFDVLIAHGSLSVEDQVRRRMDSYVGKVIHLADDIADSSRMLQAECPDLIFYTDLGMSPSMHILAQVRNAPVQVTSWGLPYTSGIKGVDYYISSCLTEPAGAQRHYVERLALLETLPCVYMRENLPVASHKRDYFFLEEDEFLFGCLQNTIKYHPDFDAVLEAVAVACPKAKFVIAEDVKTVHTILLLDRLSVTAPTFYERIHPVAIMGRDEYVSLAACIDVLIDPPYFGSGVSFYESISTGTPTVASRGKHLRNRYLAGAYAQMGLVSPPIGSDLLDVVRICTELYENRANLLALRSEILNKVSRLYDRLDTVAEFERLFLSLVGKAGSGLHPQR